MTWKPDESSRGFVDTAPDPLRYERVSRDPDEVACIISSMIPRGARILDVGCGTGSVTAVIAEMTGGAVIGVEPDETRVAAARARGIDARVGLLTESLLAEIGTFDAVVFADVLEHLPNPAALLALAKQALRPGGAVVLSVPNIAHWFVRFDLAIGRFDYREYGIMDATHLRWFTQTNLERFLKSAGFSTEQYRATAGLDTVDYRTRVPWRWMDKDWRERMVRHMSKKWPTLFGLQHVVRAAPLDRF